MKRFVFVLALLGACYRPPSSPPVAAPASAPATTPRPDASAGLTYTHHLANGGEDAVITTTRWDVVVATVTGVSGHEATFGNPPVVDIEVTAVLRGDATVKRNRTVWAPFPHDIDTSGREADLRAWNATPMRAPRIGERFVLVGSIGADGFAASPVGRFPHSAEKEAWARKAIASAK